MIYDLLKALDEGDIDHLSTHLSIKNSNFINLANKIFNLDSNTPIHTLFHLISKKKNQNFSGLPLKNPLNNCFLNSAINAISACNKVKEIFLNDTLEESDLQFFAKLANELSEDLQLSNIRNIQSPSTLQSKIKELFTSIKQIVTHKTDTAQELRTLFGQIFSKEFNNTNQHDPSEFLGGLQSLRPSLKDLFEINLTKVKKCHGCKVEKTFGQELKTQFIFAPEPSDIQTLISRDLGDEILENDNEIFCEHCLKKQPMTVSTKIVKEPEVLCIRLGRDWIHLNLLHIPVSPNTTL